MIFNIIYVKHPYNTDENKFWSQIWLSLIFYYLKGYFQ